jgi:hypothetical protein
VIESVFESPNPLDLDFAAKSVANDGMPKLARRKLRAARAPMILDEAVLPNGIEFADRRHPRRRSEQTIQQSAAAASGAGKINNFDFICVQNQLEMSLLQFAFCKTTVMPSFIDDGRKACTKLYIRLNESKTK